MAENHFLVIGGTRGIGRALVNNLVSEGRNCVSVFGRTPSMDVQTPNLTQYAVDVSNKKMLLSCIDQGVARYGKFTCVVFLQRYRAGKDEYDMDLTVALSATKNAIDHIVGKRYFSDDGPTNSIVLVSSTVDRYVTSDQPLSYHIVKAGLSQLARYYALNLGPLGIRVNTVSPCVIAKEEAKAFCDANEWLVDRFRKFIPLGRMGKSQDIVNAIMFLASEQASYITGQNIVVDGGLTLWSHPSLITDFPREE